MVTTPGQKSLRTLESDGLQTLAVWALMPGCAALDRRRSYGSLSPGPIYPRAPPRAKPGRQRRAPRHNRRARFYSITTAGGTSIDAEAALWARTVSMVNRLLEDPS